MALALLAAVFLGMVLYLGFHPTRTGVVPNYRFAASHWWTSESMYPGGTHGFLYAPPFAVLFSPVHALQPEILGEILWRAVGFGLFALGLWKLGGLFSPAGRRGTNGPAFFWMVVLAVPASLASIHNGQTNLPLSAGLILAALSLRGEKWGPAAVLLTVSLILKPIALAPWLLAFAVFPAMRIPLLVGLPGLLLAGFFHPDPSYAAGQWVEFFQKLLGAYTPENLRVSDLWGALGKAGVTMSPAWEKGIRAAACLAALIYVALSFRRHGVHAGAWALWVATALVFTVFNPRAETNSYVLVSPVLALAAVSHGREGGGGRWKGAMLAAACFGLMCDGMGKPIYLATDVWLKPLLVFLVSPLLIREPEEWRAKSQG
jgi:alpha-1,2-mannosyltransferase